MEIGIRSGGRSASPRTIEQGILPAERVGARIDELDGTANIIRPVAAAVTQAAIVRFVNVEWQSGLENLDPGNAPAAEDMTRETFLVAEPRQIVDPRAHIAMAYIEFGIAPIQSTVVDVAGIVNPQTGSIIDGVAPGVGVAHRESVP